MGTGGAFPGGKAAGAWSWPLTSIQCRGQRMSGAIPPLPSKPSWRGVQLKHRDNFTLPLSKKQILRMWTEFMCLRVGSSVGLL